MTVSEQPSGMLELHRQVPPNPGHSGKPIEFVPKIRVSGLNFYYGSQQILHDIQLTVPSNQVTALIGPSGCGKSTFLRTLNRMYETVRNARAVGEVLLDGDNTLTMDVSQLRRRVGMVFQKSNPFPKSIFDNVAYGLRINGALQQGSPAGSGGKEPTEGRTVGRG